MSKGHTLIRRISRHRITAGHLPATGRVTRHFRGDTLIEVAIAIAVFSLVAIGVVSVVNGSTSAAQNALEVTVTREEIDAQAEALRYIQNSYVAGGRSNSANNEKYRALWHEIVSHAEHSDPKVLDAILDYNPSTCAELYDDDFNNPYSIYAQDAFIINTHYLGDPIDYTDIATAGAQRNNYEANTVFAAALSGGIPNANLDGNPAFTTAATSPRILYESTYNHGAGTDDSLLDQDGNDVAVTQNYFSDLVYTTEGLYVVAVKDQDTTAIVDSGNNTVHYESAFYDFYIRSCWFAPGADRPSTISTVIRLQDPETIDYSGAATPTTAVTFYTNDGTSDIFATKYPHIYATSVAMPVIAPTYTGHRFIGWSPRADAVEGDPDIYALGADVSPIYDSFYAVWVVDAAAPSPTPTPTPVPTPDEFDLTIVLQYADQYTDLDIRLYIPSTNQTVDHGNKLVTVGDSVIRLDCTTPVCSGKRTDADRTETITATRLRTDQIYYVYIYDHTDRNNTTSNVFGPTGATVTASSTIDGDRTFTAPTSGIGIYWNVFKIENGHIVEQNTTTSARNIGY